MLSLLHHLDLLAQAEPVQQPLRGDRPQVPGLHFLLGDPLCRPGKHRRHLHPGQASLEGVVAKGATGRKKVQLQRVRVAEIFFIIIVHLHSSRQTEIAAASLVGREEGRGRLGVHRYGGGGGRGAAQLHR